MMKEHSDTQDNITPRDWNFDFTNTPKYWVNDNAYITHIFNAPSIMLPYVEGFANFTVINVLDKIDDQDLRSACQSFIKQESQHAREHIKYNSMLNKHGYICTEVVTSLRKKLDRLKNKWSPLSLLAVAVGIECFTSLMSKSILEDKVLTQFSEPADRFWKWHMMEELEHRSVLMDLYHYLGGGYLRRIFILPFVIFYYCYYSGKIYIHLLRTDNKSILQGFLVSCRKYAFFRKSLLKSLHCYRYHFHPRQIKTDGLLDFDSISSPV